MPDHFHLLLQPKPAESVSRIVQQLKQRTARRVLQALRGSERSPGYKKMLERLRLPPTVHDKATYRAWQRRFYSFEVHSEKKCGLHARKSGAKKAGLLAGRMALVELEVLLPER